MAAMLNHRHKPSDDVQALLGSVSAPVIARAHYCDRNVKPATYLQPDASTGTEHGVTLPLIARETGAYPHYPPPREPSDDCDDNERDDDDSDEDLDDHPEDFDARADYYARYNDYLRELED